MLVLSDFFQIIKPNPPKKPPRRNLSISPSSSKSLVSSLSTKSSVIGNNSKSGYEYVYLAQSGDRKFQVNKAANDDQSQNYVKMMSPTAQQKHEAVLKQLNENLLKAENNTNNDDAISTAPLRSYNPNRKLRRIRDNFDFYPK